VLPEPKTTLPPRKRAKTEDEKEQRRIERVKRNRLAAHNSRERKRQEYEILQAEKDQMEDDLRQHKITMAQMKAELAYYRKKYPGENPEPVFDIATSTDDPLDTICPAQTSAEFPSPMSMDSLDSPRESSYQPETPASNALAMPEIDSTQYPAVSVDFSPCLAFNGGDLALSFPLQPHAPLDEKSSVLDDLFSFDQFPEGNSTAASAEPIVSLADSSVDFFGSAFFSHNSSSIPGGFPDGFDAKYSDLQSASGATFVSDEALAAEL